MHSLNKSRSESIVTTSSAASIDRSIEIVNAPSEASSGRSHDSGYFTWIVVFSERFVDESPTSSFTGSASTRNALVFTSQYASREAGSGISP